jgi:phosphoglycerol transferase MdoB-like AlkP superfamily enzyme
MAIFHTEGGSSEPQGDGHRLPKLTHRQWELLRLWVSRVLFWLGPFVNLLMVEVLNERNPFENLDWTEWWMNLALYIVLYALGWLILGRRRRTAATMTTLLFLFGIVNHYVIRFRGKILFPQDILSWQTAANVADGYDYTPDEWMYGAFAIFAVYLLLIAFVMAPQKKREGFAKQKHIPEVVLGVAAGGYLIAFFFSPWLPAAGIKTQQWSTQSNGFLLNFSIALRYSQVEQPEGYSQQGLLELIDDLSADQNPDGLGVEMTPIFDPNMASFQQGEGTSSEERDTETTPTNIICIMDESFADMSIFDLLDVDGDTMPFFHSLQENTIKGWMYSPVTGGGTATVEYEFLTGNSYTFLPDGTVAYDLYVKEEQPSLCAWAEALGYSTTAFHPYYSSGWNRPLVYEYMGFDQQIYTTDLEKEQKYFVRGYVSDDCDFQILKDITQEQNAQGEKSFIFNVTIQNHGGYDQSWSNLSRYLTVNDPDQAGSDETTEQFLDLMRATDEALQGLIEYYASIEEPTIIVLFGDHQGKLDSSAYEALYGKSLDDRTALEVERQYVTPFLIWANYDIAEAQDVMISTNYLSTLMVSQTNLPMTGYQQFLAELYEELPVINPIAYLDKDGKVYEDESDLPEELQAKLLQYSYLSYYNLFQRWEEAYSFFYLPEAS